MKRILYALVLVLACSQTAKAQFFSIFDPCAGRCNYGYGASFWSPAWGGYGCGGWGCGMGCCGPRDFLFTDNYVDQHRIVRLIPRQAKPISTQTAMLKVSVPADAEVLVQGVPTKQTGENRLFVTPPLDGPTTYTVRIKWHDSGKDNEQVLALNLKPGDQPSVKILH